MRNISRPLSHALNLCNLRNLRITVSHAQLPTAGRPDPMLLWMGHAVDFPPDRAAEVRWRRRDAQAALSPLAAGSRGGQDLVATSFRR
jgi:hypothetical protein